MTDWQRLEQVIKWTGFSTNAFAMGIGLRRSENLYQIKRGNHGISKELAELISTKYPSVNRAWLLTGQGEMFLTQTNLQTDLPTNLQASSQTDLRAGFQVGRCVGASAEVAAPQGPQIRQEVEPQRRLDIPFFNQDVVRLVSEAAGVWSRAGEPTSLIRIPGLGDCDFAAVHTGRTMAPEVPSGAIVALKEVALDAPLLPGEIYLVVTPDFAALRYVRFTVVPRDTPQVSPPRLLLASGPEAAGQESLEVERSRLKHLYLVKGIIVQKVL